ncbi:MAG: hypothetical protein KatS3mg111_0695 [Pirellulaceae bacterium]|nr:MAG: hypothetical protein KatS3mg111_0695 [Pirellulaceae bacterium]
MRWFDEEYQTPESLAVIWAPEVLNVPGKPPTRGFGGRIYFYNAKSQAIPVDGELVVHGYRTTDEKKSAESWRVEADKTFVFTGEQLTTHFSPSQLGASYSIWIPWDAVGGYREEITLIPTFKAADGKIVQGAPARVFLPGKSRDGDEQTPTVSPQVHYRHATIPSYDIEPSNAHVEAEKRGGMQTTTITVPADSSLLRGNLPSPLTPAESAGNSLPGYERPSWELTPSSPAARATPHVRAGAETHGGQEALSATPLTSAPNEKEAQPAGRIDASTRPGTFRSPSVQPPQPTFELQPWTERRAAAGTASNR